MKLHVCKSNTPAHILTQYHNINTKYETGSMRIRVYTNFAFDPLLLNTTLIFNLTETDIIYLRLTDHYIEEVTYDEMSLELETQVKTYITHNKKNQQKVKIDL